METYSDKLIRIKEEFDTLDPFNKEAAYEAVKHILFVENADEKERMTSLKDFILGRVSDKLDTDIEDIKAQGRHWERAKARHIYVTMLYIFTTMDHSKIAEHVNHSNHTTVNYSRTKVATMIEGRWHPVMNQIIDLYIEIKHISQDLGIFKDILPDWFVASSYKDEVLALLRIGPMRRSKSKAYKWFKSYTKFGKLK